MRLAILAALAAALLFPAVATASVVYQSGSGDPIHTISLSNDFANGHRLAEDFNLSSVTKLSTFIFTAFTNEKTRPVEAVNIQIYTDGGSGPQTLLYDTPLPVASVKDIGTAFGLRATEYAVNLDQTLQTGNYFVSLNVGPDQSDLFWAIIDDATNPGNNWISTGASNDPFARHPQENLFCFEGTVEGAALPEPASWALMLGGFGAIGGAMRRRQIRASAPVR